MELVGGLGIFSQALSVSSHLFLQLLDLEHQGLCFPGPLLPIQQGLVQLQLLLQQLLSLGQLSCGAGLGLLGEGALRREHQPGQGAGATWKSGILPCSCFSSAISLRSSVLQSQGSFLF